MTSSAQRQSHQPRGLTLSRKGLLLAFFPLLFELIFVGCLSMALREADNELLLTARSKEVIESCEELTRVKELLQSSVSSYCFSRNQLYLEMFAEVVPQFQKAVIRWKKSIESVIELDGNYDAAQSLAQSLSKFEEFVVKERDLLDTGETVKALVVFGDTYPGKITDSLETEMDKFLARQRVILAKRQDSQIQLRQLLNQLILAAMVGNIFLSIGLSYFFSKSITTRLKILVENMARLETNKQLSPRVSGTDEIAYVDSVLHEVAKRLSSTTAELRASEERLKTVIDDMPVGLLILHPDGTVESANPRAAEVFGSVPEQLTKTQIEKLIPSLSPKELSRFASVQETDGQRDNGGVVPIELSLKEFVTVDGQRIMAMVQDITERKEIEQVRRSFVSMVSHDLRTPLTSMKFGLGMLSAGVYGEVTAKAQSAIGGLETGLDRLLRLINNLLDLHRLEAGKMNLQHEWFEIQLLFEDARQMIESVAQQAEVLIDCQSDSISIKADKDRLTQVIVNLLSNAIKFSEPGNTVKLLAISKNDRVEIQVADQGRGIPPDHLHTIFEAFKQVEKADSKEKGGSGLGLAICKLIVDSHEGTIEVASKVGVGSTFTISIPQEAK